MNVVLACLMAFCAWGAPWPVSWILWLSAFAYLTWLDVGDA